MSNLHIYIPALKCPILWDIPSFILTYDSVTIYDGAFDPEGLPMEFDFEGVPKERVVMIDHGIARAMPYDSFTVNRKGKANTATRSRRPTPLARIQRICYGCRGGQPGRRVHGHRAGCLCAALSLLRYRPS